MFFARVRNIFYYLRKVVKKCNKILFIPITWDVSE